MDEYVPLAPARHYYRPVNSFNEYANYAIAEAAARDGDPAENLRTIVFSDLAQRSDGADEHRFCEAAVR